jgi:hypothetical protein
MMKVKYWIIATTAACLVSLISSGCGFNQGESASVGKESQATAPETRKTKPGKKRPTASRSESPPNNREDQRIQAGSAQENLPAANRWSLSGRDAAERAISIVRDSAEFAPTLAVWLLDTSPSAMQWAGDIHETIRDFYSRSSWQKESDGDEPRLKTAVVTFGESVTFVVEPTANTEQVVRAIDNVRLDNSGREVTFAAIKQALNKYLPVRRRERREVVFLVVTDEAGDDWEMVDELIEMPRKYAMPVYAIGVPAPFGRVAALDASVESGKEPSEESDGGPILQGPESRALERVRLKFAGYTDDYELMDSGFGPFGLERICRASGGAFLAVRGHSSRSFGVGRLNWPTGSTLRFEPDVMRSYLPDQMDKAGYVTLVQENAARRALRQAAQVGEVEILQAPQLYFLKRDEAGMKQELDKAQQAAAKVAPAVDRIYELLREGARARSELTGPRWQAGFDLAFGRVCAAKARIDGYNAMLAGLKRGKKFENPDSTTWILEAADTSEASSSLRNLAERATVHLQRVVEEHPGTPWAAVAEYELKTPFGWKWTEAQ